MQLKKWGSLNEVSYITGLTLFVLILGVVRAQYEFSPADGWWNVYGGWISKGLVPYRDFNLLIPPGMPYIAQVSIWLVGDHLLALRYVGVGVEIFLALGLYRLLRNFTNAFRAAIFSGFSIVLLYSSSAAIPFDYNYFSILFLVWGAVYLERSGILSICTPTPYEKLRSNSLLSGFFFALSFLVKVNWFTFFAIFYLFAFTRRRFSPLRKPTDLKLFGFNILGFGTPVLMLLTYLSYEGALPAFLRSILIDAPAAKGDAGGNFSNSLFRWFLNMIKNNSMLYEIFSLIFLAFLILSFQAIYKTRILGTKSELRTSWIILSASGLLFFLNSFSLLSYIQTGHKGFGAQIAQNLTSNFLSWAYVLPVILTIVIFITWLVKDTENWILIILCLAMIWADGSSGGIDWYGVSIPVVTVLALVLDKYWNVKFFDAIVLCTLSFVSLGVVSSWADNTYNWWGLSAGPSYQATAKISSGILQGIKINPIDNLVYTDIHNQLLGLKQCQNSMVSFPSVPLLIINANGTISDRNAEYWFDVISQKQVATALLDFQRKTPSVFVVLNVPKAVWDGHSAAFNGGKPYEQELLLNFIHSLPTNTYEVTQYPLVGSPGFSYSIYFSKKCLL